MKTVYTIYDADMDIYVTGTLTEIGEHYNGYACLTRDAKEIELTWEDGPHYWSYPIIKACDPKPKREIC